jgi:hypothetical protein
MDAVFDWCVQLLVVWAERLGITYKEINVWVFVILWPIVTVLLVLGLLVQHVQITRLRRERPGR